MNVDRKLDDETLMRWIDGDLPPAEAREAERLVAASPELRTKADALAQLREVMVAHYTAAEDEVEGRLESMWGKLEAQLGPAPAPRRSWAAGVREWLESWRSHLVTGALAAAAGALIATAAGGGRVREKIVYLPQPSEPPTTVLAAAPAEIESLEVLDGSAAVLQIPPDRDGEAATTVIWITPNEGPI
jgi:hypothetical protein